MSHSHFDKISLKGGKCPMVILTIFQKKGGKYPTIILTRFHKKEENVPLSFWQVFTKRRQMSHGHSDKLSQKGGKYVMVILTSFHKKGGKCHMVILTNYHKKEENISWTFWQVFTQRRKMSQSHSEYLSKIFGSLGGKTEWWKIWLVDILTGYLSLGIINCWDD